ncbi:MAG: DnaJ C-terminal domain-containing protein [Lacunisphaera sp.]
MPVQFKDYYQTLGVARTASADEIKQAFRKLARVHHPDVAKNKAAGEAKFKEINEAYEVLGDPEKRKQYDEMGPDWQSGAAGAPPPRGSRRPRPGAAGEPDFEFGGTGFSDFFESFFSDRRGGSRRSGRPESRTYEHDQDTFVQPGRDIEADLLVTLEEVVLGSQRKVTLRRPEMDGAEARNNTYQVRVPAGMREGQRIRLAGQGGPGHGGGEAGDLYMRVRLARHPDFTVEGDDLLCDLDLAPWEAILGAKAKIPTLDGPTILRVAPNTDADTKLRVRQRGLPREDGTRGDLYAQVRIKTPPTITAEEKALWEKLAQVSKFNPREET